MNYLGEVDQPELDEIGLNEKSQDYSNLIMNSHTTINNEKWGNENNSNNSPDTNSKVVAMKLGDFLSKDIPPREMLLNPWLPRSGLTMVYAPRGIGKTWFGIYTALAVATGGDFLGWKSVSPFRVLYLDGEMPAVDLQGRLKKVVNNYGALASEMLTIITPDVQHNFSPIPDLSTSDGQRQLTPYTDNADLIIVDNLSTLCRSGKENEGESWLAVQSWALRMRAMGKSILFVHHAGKSGQQRGTSRREDVLDTVISLRYAKESDTEEGARFEVHFEKHRGFFGDDAKAIEVTLTNNDKGDIFWVFQNLKDSTFERVVELLKEGLSQKEVAAELEINKSTVSRYARRANESGLLINMKNKS